MDGVGITGIAGSVTGRHLRIFHLVQKEARWYCDMVALLDPHYKILPEAQLALIPSLSPLRDLHFTLYGGTALALRLGHRVSVDFDFFSHLPISSEKTLTERLPFLSSSRLIQKVANTLSYITSDGVKLSFFGGIDYGRLGETETTRDGILNVASPIDLMSTKLAALTQRVEAKDYIDIYALINAGESLKDGLCGVCTLYADSVPPMEIARALTWFDGGDLHILSEEIKVGLLRAVQGLVYSAISPLPLASRELDWGIPHNIAAKERIASILQNPLLFKDIPPTQDYPKLAGAIISRTSGRVE